MKAKKSGLLKFTSVLLIIEAIFFAITGVFLLATSLIGLFSKINYSYILLAVALVELIICVVEFCAGRVGFKAIKGERSIDSCKKYTIMLVVLSVLSIVLNFFTNNNNITVMNFITNLSQSALAFVIPILYYFGATSLVFDEKSVPVEDLTNEPVSELKEEQKEEAEIK